MGIKHNDIFPERKNNSHTEDQWKIFAGYVAQNNGVFFVVVPPMEAPNAKKRLKELNIEALVVPIP